MEQRLPTLFSYLNNICNPEEKITHEDILELLQFARENVELAKQYCTDEYNTNCGAVTLKYGETKMKDANGVKMPGFPPISRTKSKELKTRTSSTINGNAVYEYKLFNCEEDCIFRLFITKKSSKEKKVTAATTNNDKIPAEGENFEEFQDLPPEVVNSIQQSNNNPFGLQNADNNNPNPNSNGFINANNYAFDSNFNSNGFLGNSFSYPSMNSDSNSNGYIESNLHLLNSNSNSNGYMESDPMNYITTSSNSNGYMENSFSYPNMNTSNFDSNSNSNESLESVPMNYSATDSNSNGYNSNIDELKLESKKRKLEKSTIAIKQGEDHFVEGSLIVEEEVRANDFIKRSDIRLKYDIEDLSDALNKIIKLEGKSYRWKEDSNSSDDPELQGNSKKIIGFIAQQVDSILPELVSKDKDGWLGVEYSSLIPVLVEAIKELKGILEADIKRLSEELKKFKEETDEKFKKQGDDVQELKSKLDELTITDDGKKPTAWLLKDLPPETPERDLKTKILQFIKKQNGIVDISNVVKFLGLPKKEISKHLYELAKLGFVEKMGNTTWKFKAPTSQVSLLEDPEKDIKRKIIQAMTGQDWMEFSQIWNKVGKEFGIDENNF